MLAVANARLSFDFMRGADSMHSREHRLRFRRLRSPDSEDIAVQRGSDNRVCKASLNDSIEGENRLPSAQ